MSSFFLPLRPYLLKYGLLSSQCFEDIFIKFNFTFDLCLKGFLSKLIGLAIVMGSALVKLPQVFKIFASGSAEGISFFGTLLELLAVTANGAYSFSQEYPFSAYGEAVFLSFQTSLVALMILFFGGQNALSFLFTAIYGSTVYAITQPGLIPQSVLWYGQAANIPLIIVGKMIQIITNFRNGHTGQLSAITVFLLAGGALARIFTSIQETGDKIIILTYVVGTFVNCILAAQVLWYWNATKKALAKSKRGQAKGAGQQHQAAAKKKGKPKKA